ncbi:radical SAM protein [Ruminococcus sp. JL13D9]|uniref:SPL family radical SAM protein n=1 Tax=Ruminococcus sp. JL13D9 TaxID=3233381 RepID=UPI00389AB829
MHYTKVKGILSQNNGMNLYRGCTHGCIYCDSRSNCYQMNHEFEDIEVKENAIELLENALRRKRKRCMIGTGSMSDPYMPLEAQLEYTRKALLLIEKYGFGATLITKSDRVLRDLDILKRINQKTKAVVQMTLTTADEALCKLIEPNVSTTKQRFEALKILRDNNIPTVVWLCPVLPYINDTEDNICRILDMCVAAKVRGIICFGIGLTLREGNREYFYRQLDKSFPGLKERYIREYGNQYVINSPKSAELMRLFHRTCEQNGIMHDNDLIFEYLSQFEEKNAPQQLSLWD